MYYLFELVGVVLVCIAAACVPDGSFYFFRRVTRWLSVIGRRRVLCVLAAGGIAATVAIVMSLAAGLPNPSVHDEFGYLLGADTFAHGRLTNPTHPLWESFETFYIFHTPTYQMKFPPGQSIFLALGQVLGHPVVGVWLSLALAMAATAWMLQGWLPGRWALYATLLALITFPLYRFWGYSYWGGAVAMLGGALLFGALPRLAKSPNLAAGICFGFGGGILALTRPYEGLIVFLAAVTTLLVWQWRDEKANWSALCWRGVLPAVVVLAMCAGWLGYHNYRVTGNALKLPYQRYNEIYSSRTLASVFGPGVGGEKQAQRRLPFPRGSEANKQRQLEIHTKQQNRPAKAIRLVLFYTGIAFVIPLIGLACAQRSRELIAAVVICIVVMLAVVMQSTQGLPHYTAPIACLMFFLFGYGMRSLSLWHIRHTPVGMALVCGLPLVVMVGFVYLQYDFVRTAGSEPFGMGEQRAFISDALREQAQRDLVLVKYTSEHDRRDEWVFNAAEIDEAEIVWARFLDSSQNRKLVDYFSDRKLWLLEPDVYPARLTPQTREQLLALPPDGNSSP